MLSTHRTMCFRPVGMAPIELQEGTRQLIANLTRLPVALRRARLTWRHTRDPYATSIALVWNWRTYRALRGFPLRDLGDTKHSSQAFEPQRSHDSIAVLSGGSSRVEEGRSQESLRRESAQVELEMTS